VSYRVRIAVAAVLMASSFFTVAFGKSTAVQLIGVCFAAAQSGLGEATMLSLATTYPESRDFLTAWSSGTGMAGVFGYLWVVAFNVWLKKSFSVTITAALSLCYFYLVAYFAILTPSPTSVLPAAASLCAPLVPKDGDFESSDSKPAHHQGSYSTIRLSVSSRSSSVALDDSATQKNVPIALRIQIIKSLWPYTVPLFLVYASEYMLQAGVWSAIGFPVDDEKARNEFYKYANWLYQVGVFFSRSSGTIWNPSVKVLWALPIAQCLLLGFFYIDAVYMFWYNKSLYILCVVVGIFGGAVYVNAFKMISNSVSPEYKEIAMSGASVADTLGIAVADGFSVLLQACLYKANHISGAVVHC